MKGLFNWQRLAIAVLGAGMVGYGQVAQAAGFEQQEMDQSRVIAIAAPVAGGTAHQLLILEQLSDSRACWQEQGTTFRTVDPLLLNFDFTGICGRSTDSNGYSLRVAGQDLGMQYSLRVIRQSNDLVLMAMPSGLRRTGTPIEIGRAHGLSTGFSRIELNPGWRMARRAYNGQSLGHIYLTNDLSLAQLQQAVPAAGVPTPPTPVASLPTPAPTPVPATPPSSGAIAIPVELPPVATEPSAPLPLPSAPTPAPLPSASPLPATNSLPTVRVNSTPRVPTVAVAPSIRLTTYTGSPAFNLNGTPGTTRPGTTLNPGLYYRVVVGINSPNDEVLVRSRVTDAFRTTVNGRAAMQVGVFRDRDAAEHLLEELRQGRLDAEIIEIRLVQS